MVCFLLFFATVADALVVRAVDAAEAAVALALARWLAAAVAVAVIGARGAVELPFGRGKLQRLKLG